MRLRRTPVVRVLLGLVAIQAQPVSAQDEYARLEYLEPGAARHGASVSAVDPSADAYEAVGKGLPSTRSSDGAAAALEPVRVLPRPAATQVGNNPGTANDGLLQMLEAGFTTGTIHAFVRANHAAFDTSAASLIALRDAGLSEALIAELLQPEVPAPPAVEAIPDGGAEDAAPAGSADRADSADAGAVSLSATGTGPQSGASPEGSDGRDSDNGRNGTPAPRPQVLLNGREFASATAQVAVTESRRFGSSALSALASIGGRALAFATPTLQLPDELNGLLGSGDPRVVAVWALPGASSVRDVAGEAVFDVEFAGIPGVDPDQFEPLLVQLVATRDNYRLIGAVKSRLSELDSVAPEDIIQERIGVDVVRLERGRYRITLVESLAAGQYAVVLRPRERSRRRRNAPESLGDLMGRADAEILYYTWDFSIGS